MFLPKLKLFIHDLISVMNISTSGQLIFPVSCSGFAPPRCDNPSPITYFPYFNQQYLAVAATLNGGNVLSHFVKMIQQWFTAFGKLVIIVFSMEKETKYISERD